MTLLPPLALSRLTRGFDGELIPGVVVQKFSSFSLQIR
jgi:hypothetical protein